MIKQLFTGLVALTCCVAPAHAALSIEKVDATKDLNKEKVLFVSFYKGLYGGGAKEHYAAKGITDIEAEFSRRFDSECKQLQDSASSMTALRVVENGEPVGLAVFKELDSGKLRLMRCALDFKKDVTQMGQLLVKEVFKHFPKAISIVNVVLKKSNLEITLLKQFGFQECALVDSSYDAALFTSYELKKK